MKNLNLPFVVDPKTKDASVSLTLLTVSFIAAMTAAWMHMFNKIDDTSIIIEIFYASCGLYFGRKININGKTFSSDVTSPTNPNQDTK